MDIKTGDRVRYVGNYPQFLGKTGKVDKIFMDGADVYWDGEVMVSHVSKHNLRVVIPVGGVTTPKREVVMSAADAVPTIEQPASRGAGLKHDGGKPRPSLLMEGVPLALAEVVQTLTFGAQKYEAHSWKKVENAAERYQDASYRHDSARCRGEQRDPETGIMHRAHHIINELFLLQLEMEATKETT